MGVGAQSSQMPFSSVCKKNDKNSQRYLVGWGTLLKRTPLVPETDQHQHNLPVAVVFQCEPSSENIFYAPNPMSIEGPKSLLCQICSRNYKGEKS